MRHQNEQQKIENDDNIPALRYAADYMHHTEPLSLTLQNFARHIQRRRPLDCSLASQSRRSQSPCQTCFLLLLRHRPSYHQSFANQNHYGRHYFLQRSYFQYHRADQGAMPKMPLN